MELVDAVGITAVVNEFLTPYFTTSVLNLFQSYLSDGLVFHKSNWNLPSDNGEPLNVAYAPCSLAKSFDALIAA